MSQKGGCENGKTERLKLQLSENCVTILICIIIEHHQFKGKPMKIRLKSSLHGKVVMMTVVPLLILGCFIAVYCFGKLTSTLQSEVAEGLNDMCAILGQRYDEKYPGDYILHVEDGKWVSVSKGGQDISESFEIMDNMQQQTGVDFSVFFYDTRVLTTLRDDAGNRIIGTTVNNKVFRDVYENGEDHFYTKVDVNGDNYFAYYKPLSNENGTRIGMLFAGKPTEKVERMIGEAVVPILLTIVIAVLITMFFCLRFTTRLVDAIMRVERFLSRVEQGEFTEKMGMDIQGRSDEIGSMARAAVKMQNNLCDMVDRDALTGLLNRRYGNLHLEKMQERTIRKERVFTVAIGDIDLFKKVNDTYGHKAGDEVLKKVSTCLKKHVAGKGVAIRWGGEEFLLVFETLEASEAMTAIEEIMQEIRGMVTISEEHWIKVTMTFGVMQVVEKMEIKELISLADEKLYYGKRNGRNRVVTILGKE